MKLTEHQIEFMMKRALGICLTDRRPERPTPASVGFDPVGLHPSYWSEAHFPALMLLMDFIPFARQFDQHVLKVVEAAGNRGAATRLTVIDLDKTALSLANGGPIKTRTMQPGNTLDADFRLACLLVAELLGHAEIILTYFGSGPSQMPEALREPLKHARHHRGAVLENWTRILARFGLEDRFGEAKRILSEPLRYLKNFVSQRGDGGAVECYRLYQEASDRTMAEAARKARTMSVCLAWRSRFVHGSIAFRSGTRFRYLQQRTPEHLYELWCFSELARTLFKNGGYRTVQRLWLKARNSSSPGTRDDRSQFVLAHPSGKEDLGLNVYFDFYGRQGGHKLPQQIFAGDHVEWFLECGGSLKKSIVMDAKCKVGAPEDTQKIVYYMEQFDARIGVVYFASELPGVHRFNDPRSTNRIAISTWKDNLVCAVALVPSPDELARNEETLSRLFEWVLRPALGPDPDVQRKVEDAPH